MPNASIVLRSHGPVGRILFVRENSGMWTLPGGSIKHGETPWHAAKREFREETANHLPDLRAEGRTFEHFVRHHQNGSVTHLYVGKTCERDLHFRFDPSNRETNALAYFTYDQIMQGHVQVHGYIVNSLRALRHAGLV
jgi:ADP-ribose pyrophosphatase YjhB (NUDIX family)